MCSINSSINYALTFLTFSFMVFLMKILRCKSHTLSASGDIYGHTGFGLNKRVKIGNTLKNSKHIKV